MQHKIISGKKIEEQLMKELKRNPHLGKIAGICKGLEITLISTPSYLDCYFYLDYLVVVD